MSTRSSNEPPTIPPAAVAALMSGRMIEAIKLVRQERRLGLKEAKDLVDAYVAQHPEVRTALANAPRTVTARPVLWIVVAALLVWLAWRALSPA